LDDELIAAHLCLSAQSKLQSAWPVGQQFAGIQILTIEIEKGLHRRLPDHARVAGQAALQSCYVNTA
jgi:hypothetical protein